MNQSANVKSVQVLVEFKNALGQFQHEAQQSLDFIAHEIRRCHEWLMERQHYWQRQVEDCQEAVQAARRALDDCLQDEDGGDCSDCEDALSEAYHELREAEEELSTVQHWRRLIEQAIHDYERQTYRLAQHLHQELPKAGAFLERKAATLEAYRAQQPVSGITLSTSESSLSIGVSPAQVASARVDSVLNTIKTAALLDSLTHLVIHGIDWLARHRPKKILGDAGEEIAAYLLSEQSGFQEVAFDQPHQGFDRVFSAPGLPLIIVESKVSQTGTFRPGNTQHGSQGSPEWIQRQAGQMANPASKKWSPANEEIATTIQQLGAENIPVIAVVTQTETGTIDIYYRAVGSDEWQPWQRDLPLADVLGATSAKPGSGGMP